MFTLRGGGPPGAERALAPELVRRLIVSKVAHSRGQASGVLCGPRPEGWAGQAWPISFGIESALFSVGTFMQKGKVSPLT